MPFDNYNAQVQLGLQVNNNNKIIVTLRLLLDKLDLWCLIVLADNKYMLLHLVRTEQVWNKELVLEDVSYIFTKNID